MDMNWMQNETIQAIIARRSVRKYLSKPVESEKLEAVLQAGTYAPTSRGKQAPFIVAVENVDLKQKLAQMNAQIMGVDSNPYYDAPVYVLVFAPAEANNPIQDSSCVLQNMMVAAQAVGLASCWIHREKEMFQTEEGKKLMTEMGLPDGLMGIGALSLGYADGPAPVAKPRKEDYYRIIR